MHHHSRAGGVSSDRSGSKAQLPAPTPIPTPASTNRATVGAPNARCASARVVALDGASCSTAPAG